MKILQNEITGTQTSFFPPILVVNWVPSCLSFSLSASIVATYIFTAPTCTTLTITLEPCGLNAEFQPFIWGFNKINLLTLRIPLKERIGGKRDGDFANNSITANWSKVVIVSCAYFNGSKFKISYGGPMKSNSRKWNSWGKKCYFSWVWV